MSYTIRVVRVLAAAACSLAFLAQSNVAAAAQKWTFYTYAAVPTTSAVKGITKIVKEVEAETKGELKIKIHLGGTLQIKASSITPATGEGVIDMASDLFYLGNVPIGGVLALPMLISDDEEWAKAYTVMEPYMKSAFEKRGLVFLGAYRYPAQVAFGTKPIDSLADLNGRKMRVTSPEQGEFVRRFGGVAVTMGGSEVPTALQRGVVEGVFTASAGGAKNWHEMLPYNYRFPVNYNCSVIIANKASFQKLSPKAQEKLKTIVARIAPEITTNFNKDELVQMESQQKGGMTIVPPKPDDVKKAVAAMTPYWDQWAEKGGPEFVEALGKVRKVLGK